MADNFNDDKAAQNPNPNDGDTLEEFWNEIHPPPLSPPPTAPARARPPEPDPANLVAGLAALMRPDLPLPQYLMVEELVRHLRDMGMADDLRQASRIMRVPQTRAVSLCMIMGIIEVLLQLASQAALDEIRETPPHELYEQGCALLFPEEA